MCFISGSLFLIWSLADQYLEQLFISRKCLLISHSKPHVQAPFPCFQTHTIVLDIFHFQVLVPFIRALLSWIPSLLCTHTTLSLSFTLNFNFTFTYPPDLVFISHSPSITVCANCSRELSYMLQKVQTQRMALGDRQKRRKRNAKAIEPAAFAGQIKICPFCSGTDHDYKYLNNHKCDQPRYKCKTCHKLFSANRMRPKVFFNGYKKKNSVEQERLVGQMLLAQSSQELDTGTGKCHQHWWLESCRLGR